MLSTTQKFFNGVYPLVTIAKSEAERNCRVKWMQYGMCREHLFPEFQYSQMERDKEKFLYSEFIRSLSSSQLKRFLKSG